MISQLPSHPRLELWAGAKFSANRVRAGYLDQRELTGHASRPDAALRRDPETVARAERAGFPLRHGW